MIQLNLGFTSWLREVKNCKKQCVSQDRISIPLKNQKIKKLKKKKTKSLKLINFALLKKNLESLEIILKKIGSSFDNK